MTDNLRETSDHLTYATYTHVDYLAYCGRLWCCDNFQLLLQIRDISEKSPSQCGSCNSLNADFILPYGYKTQDPGYTWEYCWWEYNLPSAICTIFQMSALFQWNYTYPGKFVCGVGLYSTDKNTVVYGNYDIDHAACMDDPIRLDYVVPPVPYPYKCDFSTGYCMISRL